MESTFDAKQIEALDKKLDARLVSTRQGGGGTSLKYIEGHDAIDQANRLFGYGNWTYRPLSCEQTVLLDPMTGEAVGVSYKAQVELVVRGCVAPLVEVGSQPVAAWNVNDAVMSRRKRGDNKPVEEWERVSARRTIVESHEMAEKGAVTDALKRALRTFGDQFGNGLYGDGRVEVSDATETRSQAHSGAQQNGTSDHSNVRTDASVVLPQASQTVPTYTNLSDIPSVRMLRETAAKLSLEWDNVLAGAFERFISEGKVTLEALKSKGSELPPDYCKRIAIYLQSRAA